MRYAWATLLLLAVGFSYGKDKKQGPDVLQTSSSAYHVGKLALVTAQHAYDWQGHYTSSNGSVDVYCDSSSYETNCTDSPGPSGHYEVILEGESTAREYSRHTLTPIAVFVEGKQIKLNRDLFGGLAEDYDPLKRDKEQLSNEQAGRPLSERLKSGITTNNVSFTYRLATVEPRTPLYGDKGRDVGVYCVPFKQVQLKGKKMIQKSIETCYQLYESSLH